jgi:hypothetical protein
MEFPVSFFLDYAWNVRGWNENNLTDYYTQWASEQFGPEYANEIGTIIQKYSQYNARRKPELLNANTYSIENYDEADRVTDNWNKLLKEADSINNKLPDEYRDAFFELVLHPVKACANLQNMYTAVGWNLFYAKKHDLRANKYAEEARQFYGNDSLISAAYNRVHGGKWNHMMDQTHIGYTYWQEPRRQKIPDLHYVSPDSAAASAGAKVLPEKKVQAVMPESSRGNIFYELNGYISVGAAHYTGKKDANDSRWKIIPGIGREGDGITTFPVTARTQSPGANTAHLDYAFYCYDTGAVKLNAYFSPTLNFHNDSAGLQYAVSIDNETPRVISINKNDADGRKWNQWVANNIIIKTTDHFIDRAGKHTLSYWMISPAVILQKIVLDFGGLRPSYLGPQETIFSHPKKIKQ